MAALAGIDSLLYRRDLASDANSNYFLIGAATGRPDSEAGRRLVVLDAAQELADIDAHGYNLFRYYDGFHSRDTGSYSWAGKRDR